MRITTFLLILFPLVGSAQKKSGFHPDNCIQIDSNTFFGQTEITNIMYHQFVNYVKDSMLTHLLYNGLPYNEAKILLNIPKKELKTLSEDRRQYYAQTYGLNYDKYKSAFTWDSLKIDLVKSLYYPQPDRYYKRREIDVNKLLYKMPSGELIPVYPDTTCWVFDYDDLFKNDSVQDFSFVSHYLNTYFWHPAYDNYPVVGLNFKQMMAYCDWYEYQLNAYSKNKSIHYNVSIPTIEDYVAAMKYCVSDQLVNQIGPENLKEPILYQRKFDDAVPHIHPAYQEYSSSMKMDTSSVSKAKQWAKTNTSYPILDLLGGPAEVVTESNQMIILGGDYYLEIVDSNTIQANTLFYKRVASASKGYSTVGFRVVVTQSKIRN